MILNFMKFNKNLKENADFFIIGLDMNEFATAAFVELKQ